VFVRDGRGANKRALAEKNKKQVEDWFKKNPDSTITECCKGVGLSFKTVRKHIDSIQKEG
jgi:predicted ArsR family transcriptional regulator